MGKLSKSVVQFHRVCKQIGALNTATNNCEDRAKFWKINVSEQNIENPFSELSQIESDKKWWKKKKKTRWFWN